MRIRIYRAAVFVLIVGIGFILASSMCISLDSLYDGKMAITPLNNLLYNMDPKNLASMAFTHGRCTPWLTFPYSLVPWPLSRLVALSRFYLYLARKKHKLQVSLAILRQWLWWDVLQATCFFLSIAPHQELRFLVPLIFPTILVFGSRTYILSPNWWKTFVVLWILMNAGCAIVFGVLHQGGVTKALCALQQRVGLEMGEVDAPAHIGIVFSGTYMPPRFLLAIPENEAPRVQTYDIPDDNLLEFIRNITTRHSVVYLVCPQTIEELCELQSNRNNFFERLELIDVFWPHFSGEQFRSDLTLRLYKYSNVS